MNRNIVEDFNVPACWEHRNSLDSGEKFEVETKFSRQTATLEAGLEFPDFCSDDVSLSLRGEGQIVDRVSYDAESVEAGAEIRYFLNPRLSFSIGSEVKYSDVRDGLSQTEFYLVSFPVQSTLDTTDDLLDPKQGWVLFGEVRPYKDIVNANTGFVKSTISASFYHTVAGWLSPTTAQRPATGNIRGEPTASIPADERFYSGGGGSVRGFAFQSLSQEAGWLASQLKLPSDGENGQMFALGFVDCSEKPGYQQLCCLPLMLSRYLLKAITLTMITSI